jgi:hypothetical protein
MSFLKLSDFLNGNNGILVVTDIFVLVKVVGQYEVEINLKYSLLSDHWFPNISFYYYDDVIKCYITGNNSQSYSGY